MAKGNITKLRGLVAEAYNAFEDEFLAWSMWKEDDDYFDEPPSFFDFVARYLNDKGVVVECERDTSRKKK